MRQVVTCLHPNTVHDHFECIAEYDKGERTDTLRGMFYDFLADTLQRHNENPHAVVCILEPFAIHLTQFLVPLDYSIGIDMANCDHLRDSLKAAYKAIEDGSTVEQAYWKHVSQ